MHDVVINTTLHINCRFLAEETLSSVGKAEQFFLFGERERGATTGERVIANDGVRRHVNEWTDWGARD